MPKLTKPRQRNISAMSSLLRKGGVHQRSKTGVRANIKHDIEAEISDWKCAVEDERLFTTIIPQTESGEDAFG